MQLIQPIFVNQSDSNRSAGLGIENSSWSHTEVLDRIQKDTDLGVDSFLLFITPNTKTWTPDWSFNQDIVNKIKTRFPDIELIVDVCLCSTLPDGHCRVLDKPDTSEALLIDLGKKLESAGADILAPSDMGEHTVKNLKAETKTKVMAYVKYRSVFYSSFRDLADSTPTSGRTYQLPIDDNWGMIATANQYLGQKADYILLKPAQHSLSDLSMIKSGTYTPVGVYQVSDEYRGLPTLQHQLEIAEVYRRAGAKFMVSYGTRDLVKDFK
jgi:porphobilinogen synthase